LFDFESKLDALADNYGIELILEQNDITPQLVIKFLIDEKLIDLDDYFNTDVEMETWKELER
jgi:hypothetical protein|tara:strand:- start:1154 stop:1339 length:186 start_codon:yes stop_codon:yes gene_type:complete